jgi:predicted GNAT superfamily acetyltransferase
LRNLYAARTYPRCWRKIDGAWQIRDIAFTDDWNAEEYRELIVNLKNTAARGGGVFGAFADEALKGFSSVEPGLFGKNNEYLDLSNLHVSEDMRSKGIGKELFRLSKEWAKRHGAQKLSTSFTR